MIRTLILSVALVSLAGCVSVLKQPDPPDAYYRIGPMEPTHRLNATVTIREPEASRLFSGRTIAAEDETGALRIVRGVQWTDNATEMMQGALLDSFSGEGEYAALPSSSSGPTQFELNWRLSEFTLYGDTARCRLDATLLRGRTRAVISQTSVATTAVALDSSNAARAKALTDAGRACVSSLAAFIAEETAEEPAAP
ncbi:MAG: ABC-type transport auxiliary lipoprotein family protein [Hyphomonas sp.]|jgi:cholesterol transport system auxiliary component|nr:ABC-type transport auxiliary lipoprotein family protein [Hyphomonas sp.]